MGPSKSLKKVASKSLKKVGKLDFHRGTVKKSKESRVKKSEKNWKMGFSPWGRKKVLKNRFEGLANSNIWNFPVGACKFLEDFVKIGLSPLNIASSDHDGRLSTKTYVLASQSWIQCGEEERFVAFSCSVEFRGHDNRHPWL